MESRLSGPEHTDPEIGNAILDTFADRDREALRDTTLVQRMLALDAAYARIGREHAVFRKSAADFGTPIACPDLCGSCCIHFLPDTMPIEADRIAFHLLTGRRDLIDHFFENKKAAESRDAACPFWNPEKPGENCMIYPVRPLVCRLFGFSSTTDKNGEPTFSLCRHMPPHPGIEGRSLTGTTVMEGLFGAVPPHMADFSREIVGLDPQEAGRRTSICEALPLSLSKVSLLLQLAKSR